MDVEKEIEVLNRDLNRLTSLVKEMREQLTRTMKRQHEGINQLLGDSRQLFKNDRFVFEMLYPVFNKMFPDDIKYQAEFDRILGKDVGPEDPRKRP